MNIGLSSVEFSRFTEAIADISLITWNPINTAITNIEIPAAGDIFLLSLSALRRIGFTRIQDFIALSLDSPHIMIAKVSAKPITSTHKVVFLKMLSSIYLPVAKFIFVLSWIVLHTTASTSVTAYTTIDAFLSTMPAEQNESSGLDYAMDYTAYLLKEETNAEQQENVPKLRGQDLIDGFLNRMDNNGQTDDSPQAVVEDTFVDSIAASDEEEQKDMNVEPVCDVMSDSENDLEEEASSETSTLSSEDLDDSCFTETLAKIYIKQHRYEKALEIIKKLSLNYPKKNAYFADQIRFLEKLIINAKTK